MIHECMLLEYSGRLLAVIHWASMLKMLVFLVLFALLYLPLAWPLVLKVLLAAAAVSVVETLNNKIRLFKVRVYLAAGWHFVAAGCCGAVRRGMMNFLVDRLIVCYLFADQDHGLGAGPSSASASSRLSLRWPALLQASPTVKACIFTRRGC